MKFDVKVKKGKYGVDDKVEVTFIVDGFNDVIDLFKLENNIKVIEFLEKFKTYNPELENSNRGYEANGRIHI